MNLIKAKKKKSKKGKAYLEAVGNPATGRIIGPKGEAKKMNLKNG